MGTLHQMEALMETLPLTYGMGITHTQPQAQNQSYQHLKHAWVNLM